MKDASWDKFLPHFKKQNVKRKKLKRREKVDTPFPPE
jgi:ribosomal RNA assembly protein